jgi:hypothetical protein
MAALLHFPLARGAVGAANTITTLKRDVAASLDRLQAARPVLVCHWLQDADGRLSCYWEIELPAHPPWEDKA